MTDRLGGYWLGARLDGGGRVVVREAYDEAGGRHALGVPCLPDAEARARLAASAEAAGRVHSLSVAKVTAVCLDGEAPYLVSEYIEGPTLRQVVERHGPYSGDDLYRLAAATATALMRLLIARLGELAAAASRRSEGLPALVEQLLELRGELRGKGCYDVADALRQAMARGGVAVEDTPHGPRWSAGS